MSGQHDTTALTVILPVYNGAATMREQLDALVDQRWDGVWEILIVDNASTDDTASIAAEYASRVDRVRVVSAPAEHNLSYVRNVGVAAARGRSVAFCDDDDVVGDGWVAAMGNALEAHRVVASRMEYATLSEPAALVGRGEFQSHGIETLFGYPVVNGASGWRRSLWLDVGGNDEALGFTGEDHDMALRAHLATGVEPYFCEDAVYHCRRRAGLGATFRQARRYGRAQALLFRRYGRGRPDARLSIGVAVKHWLWLVRHVLDVRRPAAQTLWAWRAGLRVGRLAGSLRYRTRYL